MVLLALAGTGYLAARFGAAPAGPAALRTLLVGALTMTVTCGLGAVAHTVLRERRGRPGAECPRC